MTSSEPCYIITERELDQFEEEMFLTGHDELLRKICGNVYARPAPDIAGVIAKFESISDNHYNPFDLYQRGLYAGVDICIALLKKAQEGK